jgi:hypothetical protein
MPNVLGPLFARATAAAAADRPAADSDDGNSYGCGRRCADTINIRWARRYVCAYISCYLM